MSQIGQYQNSNMIISAVDFLQGNTGGQIPPDLLDTIYVIGTGNINVAGNSGTSTLTISLVGTTNNAVQIGNPSGGISSIPVGTNGQVLIGATGSAPAFATITSSDGSIVFTPGPNSLDMISTISTDAIETITGNTGGPISPTANNVNIVTANSNIVFAGSGSTETLDFGLTNNVILGSTGSLTSGTLNTGLGKGTLASVSSGTQNTSIGFNALNNISTGSNNIGIGYIGGLSIFTGSNNIDIGNSGIFDESNTIRIGQNPLQTSTFITGINGVNVGAVANIVTMSTAISGPTLDQLGTATLTAGVGITVIPSANTITISATGVTPVSYTNVNTSPYIVLPTDEYLSVDASVMPIIIEFPDVPLLSQVFIVKDRLGFAATNNITVTTVSGITNIDGFPSFIMNTNYEAIQLIGNGSSYEIY
jgi:hypothetical protein